MRDSNVLIWSTFLVTNGLVEDLYDFIKTLDNFTKDAVALTIQIIKVLVQSNEELGAEHVVANGHH